MTTNSEKQEFASLCVQNGFRRQGSTFSRCIGDGIYQNISIAGSDYVCHDSPAYSPTRRKSTCIEFGFWSMYADLPEYYFQAVDRPHVVSFSPENMVGIRYSMQTFMGFAHQCEIMRTVGFPMLNSVTTQQSLLDVTYRLQRAECGKVLMPQSSFLCAPLYLSGDREAAENQLACLYAYNWLGFHITNDHLKEEGQTENYLHLEQQCQSDMQSVSTLLRLMVGKREQEILEHFHAALERNVNAARRNGIPFCNGFGAESC